MKKALEGPPNEKPRRGGADDGPMESRYRAVRAALNCAVVIAGFPSSARMRFS